MPVSFGVEFEFDFIGRRGGTHVDPNSRYARTGRWGYQPDQTAGSEIRSPVWTSINEAVNDIKEEFEYWISVNDGIVPYAYNRAGSRLGQHIHIGKPERELEPIEKRKIAKAIVQVYPFLAGIHMQPIPSNRAIAGTYCRSVAGEIDEIPVLDHYVEISDSHHGTVEFRIFDSNIPQASLTVAWIMQQIASKTLDSDTTMEVPEEYKRKYSSERSNVLRYGLPSLNIIQYLQRVKELGNVSELPSVTCVREILYLVSRYGLNPYGVLDYTKANHYNYFRNMFTNPSEFLSNLLNIRGIEHRDKVTQWKEEAQNVTNIDMLIGIAIASLQAIRSQLQAQGQAKAQLKTQPKAQASALQTMLRRSEVEQFIRVGAYAIRRIYELEGKTDREVAEEISNLMQRDGDGFVNVMDAETIIRTDKRFYVFIVMNPRTRQWEVIGTIAIRMSDGEISSLVVDRRFRGLGIARKLLINVLNLRDKPFYAYVKKDNQASLNLFKSLGFVVTEESETAYRLELR